MKITLFGSVFSGLALFASSLASASPRAERPSRIDALAGTWELVAADVLLPDGTRARDYGEHPQGRLMIDGQGRYSVQIYKSERRKFAAPDKAKGTPAEFEAAVLGSSCHFGRVEIDAARQALVFHIEGASFPNWEGNAQVRAFELTSDELSWRVPPRPDGSIPLSVWRRVGARPSSP